MQKPTFIATDDLQFPDHEGLTADQIREWVNIPGEPNTCALWNGHEFEVTAFKLREERFSETFWRFDLWVSNPSALHEAVMHLYYPLDQRTNLKDWKRAVGAKPNAEGTAWIPYHTDQGTHHDIGVSFEGAVCTVFKPEVDGLNAEILELDPRDQPHGRKVLEYGALVRLQAKAIALVDAAHSERYLGEYHQEPHPVTGHVLTAVKDALAKLKADEPALWRRTKAAADRIEKGVDTRIARLAETRWDREARLAAEKAKKEAAGGDDAAASDD